MQEVTQNWQKSHFIAHNVGALSPEVKDLLDKILVIDPAQRIDIQGITNHPWCPPPLPNPLSLLLAVLSSTAYSSLLRHTLPATLILHCKLLHRPLPPCSPS